MYFAHKLAHSCLPAIAASGWTKMHAHTLAGNPDGVAYTDML